ncbi:hypothetical protein UPYG_G00340530 [Umbra pygmaea]|uniref:Actin-binding Rho-activating protein n=1 Tax=Umbra pygmaea TaxID=75934 RepID=A0ABD0VXP8_UMBPY
MTEAPAVVADQTKPSNNKNMKKLRTICMVSSLTQSWQKWVSELEDKQAKEPVGWSPDSLRELWGDSANKPSYTRLGTWEKKGCPSQNPAVATNLPAPHINTSAAQQKSRGSLLLPQPEGKRKNPLLPGETSIKTKQVVKTVTSRIQEKSTGVAFLTERICKEAQQPGEEIDKILKKRVSPTLRRKCTKVSELTRSWKEDKEITEAEGEFGHGSNCGMDRKESRYTDTERKCLKAESGHDKPGQKDSTEIAQKDITKTGQTNSKISRQIDSTKTGQTNSIKMRAIDSTRSSSEAPKKDSDRGSPKWKVESWVRVKRPSVSMGIKELDDVKKINALSKTYSAVGDLKGRWQNWSSTHTVNQKLNPFSEEFDYEYSMSLRLRKGEEGYGRPKEGTKTAERARRAEQHIHGEIADMCYVIRTMNDPDVDGKTRVTFKELFDRYVRISDKVVGILLRARKHGKVAFEGEMLWQGQDDGVIITLLV